MDVEENKQEPQGARTKTHQWNYWLITWNNPPEDWRKALESLQTDWFKGQLEEGENGTQHIQALLYYSQKKGGSFFKNRPVWAKGLQAADAKRRVAAYVTKVDTRIDGPFTQGTQPFDDQIDWKKNKKLAIAGQWDLIDEPVICKHANAMLQVRNLCQPDPALTSRECYWITGKSGVGKSMFVWDYCRNMGIRYFPKDIQTRWFDKHTDGDALVVEDVDLSCGSLGYSLKKWADPHPFTVEVKGSYTWALWTRVFITSQYDISEIWGDVKLVEAIRRRYTVIYSCWDPENNKGAKYCFHIATEFKGKKKADRQNAHYKQPLYGMLLQ